MNIYKLKESEIEILKIIIGILKSREIGADVMNIIDLHAERYEIKGQAKLKKYASKYADELELTKSELVEELQEGEELSPSVLVNTARLEKASYVLHELINEFEKKTKTDLYDELLDDETLKRFEKFTKSILNKQK